MPQRGDDTNHERHHEQDGQPHGRAEPLVVLLQHRCQIALGNAVTESFNSTREVELQRRHGFST
jgi:hypothetical protein